mmetsp:Transcript_35047/g.56581  ORF Transcript_35047/g.56581 Transcript_35047/m.56581 type:complete len:81 (-) Transcript_35047:167-409(-)
MMYSYSFGFFKAFGMSAEAEADVERDRSLNLVPYLFISLPDAKSFPPPLTPTPEPLETPDLSLYAWNVFPSEFWDGARGG